MNYNYLRYFSVLAKVEHYTLAAARLGISQPSLSSAIHHLEAELGGVQLFEKVGRNIRLINQFFAPARRRLYAARFRGGAIFENTVIFQNDWTYRNLLLRQAITFH